MTMRTLLHGKSVTLIGPLIIGALLSACGDEAGGAIESIKAPIVYGADNRKDYLDFDAQGIQRVWLDATPILVQDNDGISCDSTTCTVTLQSFAFPRLCNNERFSLQDRLLGGWATGFLIAPDLVATAAHVVNPITAFKCEDLRIVFDYRVNDLGWTTLSIPVTSTRRCLDVRFGTLNDPPDPGRDWAVIRLDAPIDRVPFIIRREGRIPDGAELGVAGYPSGPFSRADAQDAAALPVKFFEGRLINNPPSNIESFSFNADLFLGNSGSPIFQRGTGLVEGIESTGQLPDYFSTSDAFGPCFKVRECAEDGCDAGAELATRTTRLAETTEVPLTAREIMATTGLVLD